MRGQYGTYRWEDIFERFIETKYTNVHLLPIYTCLDTRYNMVYQEKNVNSRNTKYKEVVNNPINTFHPNNNGYCQIADEVMYALCGVL